MKTFLNHFLKGFLSVISIKALKGNTFEYPQIKTDVENITNDWQKVGNDMRKAFKNKN